MKNLPSQFTLSFLIKSLMLVAIFLSLESIARAAGVLDPTFGTNGRVTTNISDLAEARAVVVQPDGKIVVVGFARLNGSIDPAVVRYNSNGSLDTEFGNGGIVQTLISPRIDYFSAVALQPDGKIVAVGFTGTFDPLVLDFLIVRYNQNGTLDTSFGTSGIVTLSQGISDRANAVAVQPDGKIVVVGDTSSDTDSHITVFRLNPENGSVDTNFANNGFLFYKSDGGYEGRYSAMFGANVAILQNSRILVGGIFTSRIPDGRYYSNKASLLLLLENDGTIAQNFGSNGIARYNYINDSQSTPFDFAILPGGKILTVGNRNVLFSNNGAVEKIYESPYPYVENTDVAVRSDGKYITLNGGNHTHSSVGSYIYSPNFNLIGSALRINGADIVVQPNDKIIVIGSTGGSFTVTRLITINSQGTRVADYDADEKTDIAVLRQSNSAFYVLRSAAGFIDYNSNEASFLVRRVIPERFGNRFPSPFVYWRASGNIIGSPAAFCAVKTPVSRECVQWGMLGDIPVGGDYDGDTLTDMVVFRPQNGIWYVYQSSNNQSSAVQWGTSGDKPVPADYDYDGITDYAVYRPSTGTWWIRRSSNGTHFAVQFGGASDIPLTGDYDGDGRADLVVYRPSEGVWYQFLTTDGFRAIQFGISTDIPAPGDYDGDGRHDLAVFRQGIWYLLQSTEGFKAVQFGTADDVPVSVRYDE